MNTKLAGIAGVLLMLAGMFTNQDFTVALTNALTHPTAGSVVSVLSVAAGAILTYTGKAAWENTSNTSTTKGQ